MTALAPRDVGGERLYRVGILGNCCTHGEFVVAALRQELRAELAGGWEENPRRAPDLARALAMDLRAEPLELIEDPAIDVIAVCSDPCDKARWVEMAARAGKHIFLNKPMCESLESAMRIEAAIERYGVQLVHDIIAIRFHPVTAKVLEDVRRGAYGEPLHHAHSWGMTLSMDFPLAEIWPERLDPPWKSGGGEMMNMGCYAADYMVALWGRPQSVQAKCMQTWDLYREAGVENFGQIVADYGRFYAVLAVGKQTLRSLPSMSLSNALSPRGWHNVLHLQCSDANLVVLPHEDLVLVDGTKVEAEEYLGTFRRATPFEELVQAIETSVPPESSAEAGRLGIEVVMAAYRSIADGGAVVQLPLEERGNPLSSDTPAIP